MKMDTTNTYVLMKMKIGNATPTAKLLKENNIYYVYLVNKEVAKNLPCILESEDHLEILSELEKLV